MRFFGRNKKNASDKANERVSKRIARSKAPVAKRELLAGILPPVETEQQVFVESLSESASQDTTEFNDLDQEDVKRIEPDAPMTEEEDGRSTMVFAQDFVEELTDMVSEDAARIADTESYCCGL
jgi:hypothetical protein